MGRARDDLDDFLMGENTDSPGTSVDKLALQQGEYSRGKPLLISSNFPHSLLVQFNGIETSRYSH